MGVTALSQCLTARPFQHQINAVSDWATEQGHPIDALVWPLVIAWKAAKLSLAIEGFARVAAAFYEFVQTFPDVLTGVIEVTQAHVDNINRHFRVYWFTGVWSSTWTLRREIEVSER
jgi:hypothetical protein